MKKIIELDGKNVGFEANALTPRLYRHLFSRDLFTDMLTVTTAISDDIKKKVQADEIVENVAYVMAGQYGEVPETIEEWLKSLGSADTVRLFPVVVELWTANLHSTSTPKKKHK